MTYANTLVKKLLNVKNLVVERNEVVQHPDETQVVRVFARPNARHADDCPICHKRCI